MTIISSPNGLYLSKQYGFGLFSMFRKLYEIAIPILGHIVRRKGLITDSKLQLCREYLNLSMLKSLKSVKILLDVSFECTKRGLPPDSTPREGVTWVDVMQSKLEVPELRLNTDINELKTSVPMLLSDYLHLYNGEVLEAVFRNELGGSFDYVLVSSLRAKNSFIFSETLSSKHQSSNKSTSVQVEASELTDQESLEAIRSLFPELGVGFIETCLKVYNGNTDQVIDGILMNNLHPSLQLLDKRMQKMWVSKQDHKPEANAATYKSHMKERVRHMEKQQEYDSYLIAKEYDDDYDDQVQ